MGDTFDFWFLPILAAWIGMQVAALRRFSGWWRAAAWVPPAAMTLAVAVAVMGVAAGSNLAPIWVFFALPVCCAWMAVLWAVRALVRVSVRWLSRSGR